MIRPATLKRNDKAVILSPAGKVSPDIVNDACKVLTAWGLKVEISPNALGQDGRFSSSVNHRLSDLQNAMDDPEVKLILCSRGGYGVVHLIDKLKFDGICNYPKWIVGFSDITALHAALQRNRVLSVHGPMAKHIAQSASNDDSLHHLKCLLASGLIKYRIVVTKASCLNRLGDCSGRIFGGNLSVFCSLLGTPYLNIPRGGILFIEDIGEEPYKIDRYISQLKLAGLFDKISGLIVGEFTGFEEDESMGSSLYELIFSSIREYNFPVCFDFPIGHAKNNYPLVMGEIAFLSVSENKIKLKQFV